jgi:hypothetical protein
MAVDTPTKRRALIGLDLPGVGLLPIPGTSDTAARRRNLVNLYPFQAALALTGYQLTVNQGSPGHGTSVALSTTSGLTVAQGTPVPGGTARLTTTLETVNTSDLTTTKTFGITTATGLTVDQGTLNLTHVMVGIPLILGTTTPAVTTTVGITTSTGLTVAPGTITKSLNMPLTTPGLTVSPGTPTITNTRTLTTTVVNLQVGTITALGQTTTTLASRLLTVDQGILTPNLTVLVTSPGLVVGTTSPGTIGQGTVQLTGYGVAVDPGVLAPTPSKGLISPDLLINSGFVGIRQSAPITTDELVLEAGAVTPSATKSVTGVDLTVIQNQMTISVPGEATLAGHGIDLVIDTAMLVSTTTVPTTGDELTVDQGHFAFLTPLVGQELTLTPGTLLVLGMSVTPRIIPSCNHGNLTLTITGVNTMWTNATVWEVSGVAGVTLISSNVTGPTSATLVVTTGTATGTLTVTATG